MDLKKLGQQAKGLVDKRGGTENLKHDAAELKEIAKGPGSLADKAKAAAAAIKDPGGEAAAAEATPAAAASPVEAERAAEKVEGEQRGKHAGGHGRRRREGGRDGDPAV
jgi:hypothetical protein